MPSPPAPLPPRFGVSQPPCSPQPGHAGFRCLWEGTAKPPVEVGGAQVWPAAPLAAQCKPAPRPAGSTPGPRVVTPLARRLFQSVWCRNAGTRVERLCWCLPSAPPQEAEGWGCRT